MQGFSRFWRRNYDRKKLNCENAASCDTLVPPTVRRTTCVDVLTTNKLLILSFTPVCEWLHSWCFMVLWLHIRNKQISAQAEYLRHNAHWSAQSHRSRLEHEAWIQRQRDTSYTCGYCRIINLLWFGCVTRSYPYNDWIGIQFRQLNGNGFVKPWLTHPCSQIYFIQGNYGGLYHEYGPSNFVWTDPKQ